MFDKSLYFAGALAGALVWSAAAYAVPGEATQSVFMRSGPGISYPVIARIPAGAAVNLFGCGRWCSLEYGGRDGYVRAGTVASVAAPVYTWPEEGYDYDYGGPPFRGSFFFGFHGHHGHDGHDGGHDHHH